MIKIGPEVLKLMLLGWHRRYKPTNVVITENGVDEPGEFNATFPEVLQDEFRINYFKEYIQAAADAVTQNKACLSLPLPAQAVRTSSALHVAYACFGLHKCTYSNADLCDTFLCEVELLQS